jgi:hypothetical protein
MDSGIEKFPAGFADDARARLSAEFLNPVRCNGFWSATTPAATSAQTAARPSLI